MKTFLVYLDGPTGERYLGSVRTRNYDAAVRWATTKFPFVPASQIRSVAVDAESAKSYRWSDPELAREAARLAQGEAVRAKRAATLAKRKAERATRTPRQRLYWDNLRRKQAQKRATAPDDLGAAP